MKLAFKKGFYDGHFDGIYGAGIILKNFLDSLITFDFRGIDLCHVELVFSKEHNNISFSSVEGEGGRFKDIKYSHPERWIFIDYDFESQHYGRPLKNEYQVYEACKKIEGCNYDWLGIFGQAIGQKKIQDSNKMYCSEAIGFIQGFKPYQLNPQELYQANLRILENIEKRI